ncbi:DUF4112 domain-containing protein [Gracilimonas mengyeensis]|uniref:DUF4112 domain-containing protein n=1 Tax=Gracilimonas mengyeensis TaxID=1302730 RepID=A0A521APJ1_9BACT|nr:DUF4112 domain-containing protein [Gracilimonas mengyeensis]SMO36717.1 protein of unknown function [Gracilimonas mengyeensis]
MAEKTRYHSKSRKYAELLDSRFTIPGTEIRFGIDPLIGLITGYGDLAGAALSVYFMYFATRLGAQSGVLIRMFVNVLADLAIGVIPVLGDLFDVGWKANIRNAKLLEKLEQNPEKLEKQSSLLMWLLFAVLVAILIGIIALTAWIISEVWETLFG